MVTQPYRRGDKLTFAITCYDADEQEFMYEASGEFQEYNEDGSVFLILEDGIPCYVDQKYLIF